MKNYIGDGVYLNVQGPYDIYLTTENGVSIQNEIVLDYEMISKIKQLTDQILKEKNGQANSEV